MNFDFGWVLAAVGLIGTGVGAIAVFRKAGPESSQILVNAAQDVVLIQKGVIDELKSGLADAHRRIQELQNLEVEVGRLRIEIAQVHEENTRLRSENTKLRKRVVALENGS